MDNIKKDTTTATIDLDRFSLKSKLKLFILAFIGIFSFFISFSINGNTTILIEHIVIFIRFIFSKVGVAEWYCAILALYGALHPFISKSWNRSASDIMFTLFKVLGFPVILVYIFHIGPEFLFEKGKMLDFLFNKIAMTLSYIIPVGSAFIIFLTDYGLMEFAAIFARSVMRPVYSTPGRSAVDAVASFLGSYSIALIITGKQYRDGYYTRKEAIIAGTGFSTVSATFCLVIANALDLTKHWNLFFWGAFLVTFIVTAIVVRLRPIKKFPNTYHEGAIPKPEDEFQNRPYIKRALYEGYKAAETSSPVLNNMSNSFLLGVKIASGLVPSIMSVGLFGLILAEFTPFFSILGYIFFPFVYILRLPDPLFISEALATGLAEMFLPSALIANNESIFNNITVRYIIGVVSISQILFLSASIPCVLAVELPINLRQLIIIWYERVVLSLFVATPLAFFLFNILNIGS